MESSSPKQNSSSFYLLESHDHSNKNSNPIEDMEMWKQIQISESGSSLLNDNRNSDTSFERHIKDMYKIPLDEISEDFGISFFESWGYYDTLETNTVDAFLSYSGLDAFWGNDRSSNSSSTSTTSSPKTPKEAWLAIEDQEVVDEAAIDRSRVQAGIVATKLELSSAVAKFEKDIESIRKLEQQIVATSTNSRTTTFTEETNAGYLYVLRHTRRNMLHSSWNKRWVSVTQGELRFMKRRYWKVPKGKIKLSSITRVMVINATDFQIEYSNGNSLLLRTKTSKEAQQWIRILNTNERINTIRSSTNNVRVA